MDEQVLDAIAEAASNADGALHAALDRREGGVGLARPSAGELAVADALAAVAYEIRALRLTLASVTAELP